MADNSITLKSLTDETATVAGYGVVFGDRDLDGETFTKDTELDLDLVPAKRVFYDHTMGNVKHSLGTVLKATVDDVGVWIEAELDRSRQYVAQVLKLIEAGALGWSSGSVPHLVRRDGGVIKAWPVVEFSLTPTPCEPRTLGIERIKAMAEADPEYKALLPQEPGEGSAGADEGRAEAASETTITEGKIMDPNEIKTLVAEAAKAAATEAVEAFKASLPPVTSGLTVTKDEAEHGFKSFGEQLAAIKRAAIMPSSVDPRLLAINEKAMKATGASETVGAEGGFLVQQDFAKEMLGRIYNTGEILRRVRQRPLGPGANGLVVNVINETSRATGSRFGGVRAYWLNEGGTLTKSKPAYRRFSLNLEKLIGLYYATDELLQDDIALSGEVGDSFVNELRFAAEDSIINGTGAGYPLGVLASGATVSVAKETGQAATGLVYQNLVKMWSRMWAPDRAEAVWFINQDVEPQLFQLYLAVGTGGVPAYMPANGLSQGPYSTLFGRPVIPVEYCPTLGTVGDVILANFSNYRWIDKAGIQAASSIHVQFTTDESTFRWVWRCNGAPFDVSALTPASGSSNTLGHFVTVATRA
ncbi:MAG TPA: phage major capsid protein [Candidatus Omnitrophica bacterium]|nr:phage major capsid protein [Candidatus Omnitrophota bacterium]